ncbi:MAG: sec-independent protein translocase protein TatB [Pseudonocardiales bacterium]|jgi:sec-independent protein translocase protein TatB|uniref:twin-arginine translocase TatA/TatE family subunit n=1 Tax=Pseudonocardia sp. TaxID=60912 RepID=UPI00260C3943|nr:twin-arginine translocase TatA/TatE family subunit [Pseudonocardia sp.]MCW2718229.1 twin-arginine translocation protein TatB subunit [Pseudonocardia sp.]MDT7706910.1 sec-independent protein translocase protein TatB [Pseudonocardiales bacterium]
MFDLSIEKIMVLVVVALFVLGPERLPAAAEWLGRTIRQVKAFAAGASDQLQREIGPEFDQFRKPLADLRAPLQELRGLRDPRAAVMRHLLDAPEPAPVAVVKPVTAPPVPAAGQVLAAGERPPVDLDAT